MIYTAPQNDILRSVIAQVLPAAQLTMVRELAAASSGRPARADEMMFWMRLNMPVAAQQVTDILHPAD